MLLALSQREGANRLRGSIDIVKPLSAVWPYLFQGDKLKIKQSLYRPARQVGDKGRIGSLS
jgi:hypothetical protein